MTRSLLIAAASGLSAILAEQFEALGSYETGGHEARCVAAADEIMAPWPDAVLLDAAFCDAAAISERLRDDGFAGALIIVSEGASDCPAADATLARPFRFADLLDALERSASAPPAGFGARLTEKEAAILERLAQARGAVISKSALLADVWGYGPNVSTRTLETHVHRLRRKIETDPSRPRRLLTEDGGYRLANI